MASEPDKWDYAAAGIPSALTDDMEASQAAKKVGASDASRMTLIGHLSCNAQRSACCASKFEIPNLLSSCI